MTRTMNAGTSAAEGTGSLGMDAPATEGDNKVDGEAEDGETEETVQDTEDFDSEGAVAASAYKAGHIGEIEQAEENSPAELTVSNTTLTYYYLICTKRAS